MIRGDEEPAPRRHVPPDRPRPVDEGPADPDGEQAPGTGIFGDETLVRPADGVERPGISREIPEVADDE